MSDSSTPVRFGLLGAARITPKALVGPAEQVEGVHLTGVAARDHDRARAFADEHGIEHTYASYHELVCADEIDAVYNALPISHHLEWTLRALEAGKHVLCEKPFANNEAEAVQMRDAAAGTDLVLIEAFHWRYHPVGRRLVELVRSLGAVRRASSHFVVGIDDRPEQIRYRYELGGGATMDLGCYPISFLRHALGSEPKVVWARAEQGPEHIDIDMRAGLLFPSGTEAEMHCSMIPGTEYSSAIELVGERGRLTVRNPLSPHYGHEITLVTDEGESRETLTREPTYVFQLRAFVAAIRGERTHLPTDADDAVRQMRAIDEVYRQAGLPLRGA